MQMKSRYLIGLLVAAFCWFFPEFSFAACPKPTSAMQAKVSAYVLKKYQVASADALILRGFTQANEACFWKMEYGITSPKRSVVLFLSPDGGYLSPALYDVNLDPLMELKQKDIETAKKLAVGASAPLGPEAAPVTIVEFSDFECPFCKRMTDVLEKEVLPKEEAKVKVVFRNFPLAMHPWAKDAAEMAECAGIQKPSAFWGLHDYLFQNQQTIRPETMKNQVRQYISTNKDLNLAQFDTCVDRELGMGPVTQDQQLGQQMGIHGTPTFFVNGVRFDGFHSASELESIIDLAAKGELVSTTDLGQPAAISPAAVNVAAAARSNQCPVPVR